MKQTKIIVLANLLLLFGVIIYQITKKENVLNEGELILMEIRPVDPISYLQGYYMTLSYAETRTEYNDSIPKRGYFIVTLDGNRVAKKVRFQENPMPIHEGEYRIKYFQGISWQVNIGAESYFFEEGQQEKFEQAAYGGLHVLENGDALLANLYDKEFQLITP